MDSSELVEDFETGLFKSKGKSSYIKCEFNPNEINWIEICGERWVGKYAGMTHELNWDEFNLSSKFKLELKQIYSRRLKKNSPSYIAKIKATIHNLIGCAISNKIKIYNGFANITTSNCLSIWNSMNVSTRSIFRSLYKDLAESNLGGADYNIAKELETWKARNNTQVLRYVLNWDADQGAFTTAEWEVINNYLIAKSNSEDIVEVASCIFARILTETLKRPIQVLSMKKNALWIAPSGREFFLRIPKAKGQIAGDTELWPITSGLAKAIEDFSSITDISKLQSEFDRLVVIPSVSYVRGSKLMWMHHDQVDVNTAKVNLQRFALRNNLISPRNNESINLASYRIRHTGATVMAAQGASREEIQDVLEHDSPESADAYIQAVGSDLIPVLEKTTDRGVGKVFSEIRKVYFFKGLITEKLEKNPIYIPITPLNSAQPAAIGTCGKNDSCSIHPFWGCYNGCPHFLAWKEAPHKESLNFVEAELKRWSDAEGGKFRSKLGKDFDRVAAAIQEVINQIEGLNTGRLINELK